MNALIDNFHLLAAAPNGVAKLRELILSLAVRGKLVPQNPSEEPASELLKKIAVERARLIKEGKIKKDKSLPAIGEVERPYELPQGWEWARFGEICSYIQRGKGPEYCESSSFPVISQKCVRWYGLDVSQARFVTPQSIEKYEETRFLKAGDLLWNSTGTGTIGRAIVCPKSDYSRLVADSHVTVLRPIQMNSQFLWRWVQSPIVQREIDAMASGSTNQIELNTSTVIAHLVPLPPIAEQHRIVAKVDELMRLCDQLEAQQTTQGEAHERLVAALLDSLTQSADAQAFADNWGRLAEHFELLFDTPESITKLKQTLLQLAVQGKLVPQDPNDEPASELLKKIAAEKARLENEGLRTSASDVGEERIGWMPADWGCERLGNLAKFIDYRGRTPTKVASGIPLITAKNVRYGYIDREPREYVTSVEYEQWMTRGFPKVGDLLFTTEAPLGNVALVDIEGKFALAQRVICLQFHEPEIGKFMLLAFMSLNMQQEFEREATGMTATGIKAAKLKEILIPLPPLAEQHRIVAKVDELMQVCDALAERLTRSRDLAARLMETMVARAA